MHKLFEIANFLPVKGRTINVRGENHGSDHVICVDWGVGIEVPNTWLDNLDPALLPMFYKPVEKADEESTQAALEGVEVVSSMPLLRSTNFKFPLELSLEYVGYQLTVDRGLGGKSNLVLLEVKVNKFKLTCKEGGTVEVQFRIQAQSVPEEVRGQLSSYIKGAATALALKPPSVKQEVIDGTKGHPGAAAKPEPQKAWPFPGNGKKGASGNAEPTGHEAGDQMAANEAAGLNKPAASPKKRAGGKKPSLASAH